MGRLGSGTLRSGTLGSSSGGSGSGGSGSGSGRRAAAGAGSAGSVVGPHRVRSFSASGRRRNPQVGELFDGRVGLAPTWTHG
jgi:hypothetical protein